MHALKKKIKIIFSSKKTYYLIAGLTILALVYFFFFRTLTVSPSAERHQMQALAETKMKHDLSIFVSDGCSGNVSQTWSVVTRELSRVFPDFSEKYKDAKSIPFEFACVEHDISYHQGNGGYVGRLIADNKLRQDIIDYGIDNSDEIKKRTGIGTEEEIIFMYEMVAEAVYRGVRLGGAPCTGMPYAWGYGYNNGVCE